MSSSPLPSCAHCTGAIPTPSCISSPSARWRRWWSRIRTSTRSSSSSRTSGSPTSRAGCGRSEVGDPLDLHGSLRSAALRVLVPSAQWSRYSKRKLARTALIAAKINMYGKHVPVPVRYFEAARALDVQPDGGPPEFFLAPAARERIARWLAERGLDRQPFAALAPGAAHATKRWPIRHWVALAEQLRTMGFGLVAVGGPGGGDRELASQLDPDVHNAAGEFTLQETGACLARAAVLVSGDTGVMHMATGVGTRVVALFGPTVELFGFFPYTSRAVVLERDLGCRPCSAMGTERCPLGHHRCLEDIFPDQVAAAVQRLVA